MQLANEVNIAGVFALGEEIKPEHVLVIAGESPAIVYALGDDSRLPEKTSIRFNVKVSRGNRAFAATVKDGQNKISRKPDLSEDDSEFATFGCSVCLFTCYTHSIRTQFPQNSFRIFLMDADGSWQMEEFSIVAQNRRAFLARQLIYHGQTYRAEDGTVSDPTFDKWIDLQEMIREKSIGSRELPSLAEALVPKEAVFSQPTPEKGIVKFFSLATGWGSVFVVKDGEVVEAKAYWKHITEIADRPMAYLARGEEVTCDIVLTDPNAEKKTSFQYEAIGIRPCS